MSRDGGGRLEVDYLKLSCKKSEVDSYKVELDKNMEQKQKKDF